MTQSFKVALLGIRTRASTSVQPHAHHLIHSSTASLLNATSTFEVKFRIEIVEWNREKVAVRISRQLRFVEEDNMIFSGRDMVFHRIKVTTETSNVTEVNIEKVGGCMKMLLKSRTERGVQSGGTSGHPSKKWISMIVYDYPF